MLLRPRRSISRQNYAVLANVKIPRRSRVSHQEKQARDRLYKLEILEEDSSRVKVMADFE